MSLSACVETIAQQDLVKSALTSDSAIHSRTTVFLSHLDSLNAIVDSTQHRILKVMDLDFDFGQSDTWILSQVHYKADSFSMVREVDSVKSKLNRKIDSLKRIGASADQYKLQLDSITNMPEGYYNKARQKLDAAKTKVNEPLSTMQGKFNEKLSLMQQEGGIQSNLPGNVNLSGVEVKTGIVPDLDTPLGKLGESVSIPGAPNLDASQIEGVAEITGKIDKAKALPGEAVNKVTSVDQVQGITEKLGAANQTVDKAQDFSKDISSIARGDLESVNIIDDDLKKKVGEINEIKELEKFSTEMDAKMELIARGNDPEAMKEFAKKEGLKYATDHFAGNEAALTAAIDKMGKLQLKNNGYTTMTHITRRVPNAMRDKPFSERLLPGITFQIQKTGNVQIDLNPLLSYRLSATWNAGAGWNERISFSDWNKTVSQDRIFGPRIYTSVTLKNGYGVKLETEYMNTYVPQLNGTVDSGGRAWRWSVFAGFKKDYEFMRGVRGNFQFLYNIYDHLGQSPYNDRFTVRFGFEFPLRKKVIEVKQVSMSSLQLLPSN